jgi:hypothetical protein
VCGRESWAKATIRQTGVYQSQQVDEDYILYVFLQPSRYSPFQSRFEGLLQRQEHLYNIEQRFSTPHLLVLSCYSHNWRWYLKGLNSELERIVRSKERDTSYIAANKT